MLILDGVPVLDTAEVPEAGTLEYVSDLGNVIEVLGTTELLPRGSQPADAFATLFGGYSDDWSPLWNAREARRYTQLRATDGTKILSAFDPVALGNQVGNNETASERIERILNHADWPANLRDVRPGGKRMRSTDHAQPAWTELLLTADSDLGAVWISPDGALSYRDGAYILERYNDPPVMVLGCDGLDIILTAQPTFDLEGLRNIITASNGTHTITRADEASYTRYRPSTYKRTDLMLRDSDDLSAWVDEILLFGSQPRRHIGDMELRPTLAPESFRWVLIPDPLDIWEVHWTPPGDGTSHTVTERVTAGAWVHTVTPDAWQTTVRTGVLPPVDVAAVMEQRQRARKVKG